MKKWGGPTPRIARQVLSRLSYLCAHAKSRRFDALVQYPVDHLANFDLAPALDICHSWKYVEKRANVTFHRAGGQAFELTDSAYRGVDMTPLDLQSVFDSPFYEGTYIARSGDNVAGISLWNGSALGEFASYRPSQR